jgi:DNA-binding response OmpR family regulator
MRDTNPQVARFSVLVVGDDRAMGKLLRQNLEGRNTSVMEATTGIECLEAIRSTQVDLVLLNADLPDYDGWGILSLLRLTDSFKDLPVIVVSENAPSAAMASWLRPDDFILEPFDMRDLVTRVARLSGASCPAGC